MHASTQPSPDAYERPAGGRHALVITLDHVEPAFYTGWRGELPPAEQDRAGIITLLDAANFSPIAVTNETATREDVGRWLKALADVAKSGDEVIVYFSGHGATLPDLNNDELGFLRDGAWCLYDGMFVDDELSEALTKFNDGVRVVVISDSCFTGTIVVNELLRAARENKSPRIDERGSKLAPVDIGERVYEAQKDFYDPILTRSPVDPNRANASLLVLSACAKGELARVDENKSVFTQAIIDVWNGGSFKGTYQQLFEEVNKRVKAATDKQQNPEKQPAGKMTNPSLENRPAFGGNLADDRRRATQREVARPLEPTSESPQLHQAAVYANSKGAPMRNPSRSSSKRKRSLTDRDVGVSGTARGGTRRSR